MAKLEKGTWVLVADGEKALVLRNRENHWNPSFEILSELAAEPAEATFGKPGRRPDAGPSQMSAMEVPDLHKVTRERFARDLAQHLHQKAQKGAFQHLVVVAAPQLLGDLRGEMHGSVTSRIVGEIRKTLTHRKPHELAEIIKDELESL